MSTRSMIFVEIRGEDLGKKVKPDKEMIKANGLRFRDVDGFGERDDIPDSEIDKIPATELTGRYIGIYHHWDGYPEGVGATLVEQFNDYENALNLMLFGDESTINGELRPYCLRGGKYPGEKGTLPNQYEVIPKDLGWCEYSYLFRNGEWLYTDLYGDKEEYYWKPLAEHLEKLEADEA